MKWTRHQFAPAVPAQEVVNRAVAGGLPDRLSYGNKRPRQSGGASFTQGRSHETTDKSHLIPGKIKAITERSQRSPIVSDEVQIQPLWAVAACTCLPPERSPSCRPCQATTAQSAIASQLLRRITVRHPTLQCRPILIRRQPDACLGRCGTVVALPRNSSFRPFRGPHAMTSEPGPASTHDTEPTLTPQVGGKRFSNAHLRHAECEVRFDASLFLTDD